MKSGGFAPGNPQARSRRASCSTPAGGRLAAVLGRCRPGQSIGPQRLRLAAGVWYNVVGVLSKSEIAIYVNGVKEGSKPLSSFTDSHSAHMRIGSSAERGRYAFFDGVIDEVTFQQ